MKRSVSCVAACLLATQVMAMVPEQTPVYDNGSITLTEPVEEIRVSELNVLRSQLSSSGSFRLTYAQGAHLIVDDDVPDYWKFSPTYQGVVRVTGEGGPWRFGYTLNHSQYTFDGVLFSLPTFGYVDSVRELFMDAERFRNVTLCCTSFTADAGSFTLGNETTTVRCEDMKLEVQSSCRQSVRVDLVKRDNRISLEVMPVSQRIKRTETSFGEVTGDGILKVSGERGMTVVIEKLSDFTGRILQDRLAEVVLPEWEALVPEGAVYRWRKAGKTHYFSDYDLARVIAEGDPLEVVDRQALPATVVPVEMPDGRLVLQSPWYGSPEGGFSLPRTWTLSELYKLAPTAPREVTLGVNDILLVDCPGTTEMTINYGHGLTVRGVTEERPDISGLRIAYGHVRYAHVKYCDTSYLLGTATLSYLADPAWWYDCEFIFGNKSYFPRIELADCMNETSCVSFTRFTGFLGGDENGRVVVETPVRINANKAGDVWFSGRHSTCMDLARLEGVGTVSFGHNPSFFDERTDYSVRIRDAASFTGSITARCPVLIGGEPLPQPSAESVIRLAEGQCATVAKGAVWTADTLRVDGMLTVDGTLKCPILTGTGCIESPASLNQVVPNAVLKLVNGTRERQYLSFDAVRADEESAEWVLADEQAQLPVGWQTIKVNGETHVWNGVSVKPQGAVISFE